MKVLSTLTPREEKVLRIRLGFWSSGVKKPSGIAEELGGAADTRKFSRDEWRAKGLEVKDRSDLNRWLDSYRPSREGLWLPPDVLKGRV